MFMKLIEYLHYGMTPEKVAKMNANLNTMQIQTEALRPVKMRRSERTCIQIDSFY